MTYMTFLLGLTQSISNFRFGTFVLEILYNILSLLANESLSLEY